MKRFKVCERSQVPSNGMAAFDVEGERILMADVSGRLFALSDVCSHAEAYLSEGNLEGTEVQCPMHGAFFDVRTGKSLSPPAVAPVKTYRVIEEDGLVYIEDEEL